GEGVPRVQHRSVERDRRTAVREFSVREVLPPDHVELTVGRAEQTRVIASIVDLGDLRPCAGPAGMGGGRREGQNDQRGGRGDEEPCSKGTSAHVGSPSLGGARSSQNLARQPPERY